MNDPRTRVEIRDACLLHMVRRLSETKQILKPYPHFWAVGIFPEDVYDRILSELPDDSLYPRGGEGSKHYGNRAEVHLSSEVIEQLPESSKELWYGVRSALSAPELKQAIFAKLSAGLAHRFSIDPEKASEVSAYPRAMLYQETGGYSIAPHPDTRRKLATIQFALTNDPSQSDLGMSLYRLSASPRDLFQSPRGFREVDRHPFVRNSVVAFAVVNTITMRSWHGRSQLRDDCGVRNTLLQIYYADPADANQEMLAEFEAE